jgi:hypothetical protein
MQKKDVDTEKTKVKAVQFRISQEHKEKFAIIQALARMSNASEYLMLLIDEEYQRKLEQEKQGRIQQ